MSPTTGCGPAAPDYCPHRQAADKFGVNAFPNHVKAGGFLGSAIYAYQQDEDHYDGRLNDFEEGLSETYERSNGGDTELVGHTDASDQSGIVSD